MKTIVHKSTGVGMSEPLPQASIQLLQKWHRDASRRFADARREPDPMGRLLIEHGGVCLFNCIMDVRGLLGLEGLPGDDPRDLSQVIIPDIDLKIGVDS